MGKHVLFPRSSTHAVSMEIGSAAMSPSGLQDHEDVGGQETGRQDAEFLLELSNSRQTQEAQNSQRAPWEFGHLRADYWGDP